MDNRNNIDLDSIRDAVYELEGLLELARLREDKTSELIPLMKMRLQHINSLFSGSKDGPEQQDAEASVPEPAEEWPVLEEIRASEETRAPEETSAEDGIPVDYDSYGEYTVAGEEDTVKEEMTVSISGDAPVEVAEEAEINRGRVSVTQPAAKTAAKPAFCINDRFRFRRELFHNSDAEFSAAMDLVATMDSYEEAEEYFLSDLGWNGEDEAVIDFMAIIEKYFGTNN